MARVGIVDVGIGNLLNVERAVRAVGATPRWVRGSAELRDCSHLVLSGVGSFGDFMAALRSGGLVAPLVREIQDGTPLLGIGVGMQVLFQEGQEFGTHVGLGLFAGSVIRFSDERALPHSGWNQVRAVREDTLLSDREPPWFHFVHAYYADCDDIDVITGLTDYEGEFVSAVGRGHLWGVQFHPEKSQRAGLELFRRFAAVPAPRAVG